jgi:hypothetical protein
MNFTLPIRAQNPNNTTEHWRKRGPRVKAQRAAAYLATHGDWRALEEAKTRLVTGGLTVTLIRVGPRAMDSQDNLRAALKPVVDGITDALGLKSDADPRISWAYDQRRGEPKQYAVEVSSAPRQTCPHCNQVALSADAASRIANGLGKR